MKEFITAVDEASEEDRAEREAKIEAFIAEGLSREEAENKADGHPDPVEFKMDGRRMVAFYPTDGQLAFMLASMGRGQSNENRFASIINVMLMCLRGGDRNYLEGRLLSRGKDMLELKHIEGIFEYLTEEWFARPTQSSSDSARSLPSAGGN